ncbi:MAG: hypothetical protein CMG07_05495 [Candidatus Marinimicrobia bacterium]|nr:hypothetical protein [Candidatus Neomarinimicrobiota bacterium]|tara:strand:+ start:500 stop:1207 length:708 start_codon:yes stop_codon:yes gene_type:complete
MDRIAIVTGASSGLGCEIAFKLAKKKFHVVIIGRSIKGLKNTFDKIDNINEKCTIVQLDLCQDNCAELIEKQVGKIKGNVEVIVNNAGIGIFKNVEMLSINEWQKMISLNLTAAFLLTKLYVPKMKKNKRGILLYINSVAGKKGYPFSSGYVASKFALRGFAESVREELRTEGIKVVSIFPGAIDTPLWDSVDSQFDRKEMMTITEVAETILSTIDFKNISVIEELVIRRIKGDF